MNLILVPTIALVLRPTEAWSVPSRSSAVATKLASAVADEETVASSSSSSSPFAPGLSENALFECDPSVAFWRDFQRGDTTTNNNNSNNAKYSSAHNLREMTEIAARFAARGPDGLNYWIRHAGRSGYFFTNALLGTLASGLHRRFAGNRGVGVNGNNDNDVDDGMPFNLNSDVATRLLLEAFLCYEQDYACIVDKIYNTPWDMKSFATHRQSSPINMMTQTGRFVEEAVATLARRNRKNEEDKKVWISELTSTKLYPEYYLNAFHYQTDGWFSTKSANVYETSTETLFLGRQDAMQRSTLPAITDFVKSRNANNNNQNEKGRPLKVLEVACGTGRFMTFLRDQLDIDTEYTAVDLSPYYLEAARDNDAYWRKTRREAEERRGNNALGENDLTPLRLIQAQAEDLPFDDESFDVVVCVYLYHELPREVRAGVSVEMSRVLKKDGVLVLTDSIQRGDRPSLDDTIGNFGDMNEPYYVDYTCDDLSVPFVEEGLRPGRKIVRSTTKSLSFTK